MSATPPQPLFVPGEMLDFYLSLGYYRMHQDLFTCQYLPIEEGLYTVHWLRLRLADVQYGPAQRRLLRLNEQFEMRIQPFQLTPEYEDLYARYRAAINFDAPPTVEAVLLAGAVHNVFNTQVIELRDQGQLIAAGIFDSGVRTVAGIMNFYHPDYRKHSLGKYLMLLKIEYARRQRKTYYYPGYLVHRYPKFDYKLFPCQAATEVFDCATDRWQPFSWDAVVAQSAALLAGWAGEAPANDAAE